jgi:hypothetical protein
MEKHDNTQRRHGQIVYSSENKALAPLAKSHPPATKALRAKYHELAASGIARTVAHVPRRIRGGTPTPRTPPAPPCRDGTKI